MKNYKFNGLISIAPLLYKFNSGRNLIEVIPITLKFFLCVCYIISLFLNEKILSKRL